MIDLSKPIRTVRSMATSEQVAELVSRLQQQDAKITELQIANQQLVQQQQQQAATFGNQLAAQLAALPEALAASLGSSGGSTARRPNLIDLKGLGRPEKFDNKEESFVMWARRTQNFIAGAYLEAREILAQAAECEEVVTVQSIDIKDLKSTEGEVAEINDQVYTVALSLTHGEAADIVVGAGEGAGLEAWRKLHRRYDPLTLGRSRGLLKEIINPGRAKLEDLQGAIERLEDLIRRYESRKNEAGERKRIDGDIKMAALEKHFAR